ncbi:MAG: carboxymuconolactone decarboxylase family protein [bacterium]
MLNPKLASLAKLSTLATKPEFRIRLAAELQKIKNEGMISADGIYEVFLQTYLFVGFPAALESVRALRKVFGTRNDTIPHEADLIAEYPSFVEKGTELYQKVYATNAERVREEMIRLSPELAAWALVEGYGKTLSRSKLDSITRELCIVASLTQLGWDRQLYSHILGARNVGATGEEILECAAIGADGDANKFATAEQLIKKIV